MLNSKLIITVGLVMLVTSSWTFAQAQWALDTVIATGANSSGIAITSDGSKLVVTNNTNPGSVKIISTSTYAVSAIDVSSIENYPNAVTISRNDSIALVNTTHNVIYIDLKTNTIKGHFAAPCVGTTLYGIAVTLNGLTAVIPDLSSGCTQQGLRSIDASGHLSTSTFIPVNTTGELYGIAVARDSVSVLVSTSTQDSPKKVNLSTSAVQNISGMTGSYGLAMMHKTNEALVFDGDSLDRVSLTSNAITKKISPLSYNTSFQNIAITADDQFAFVAGAFEKLVISLARDSVIQTFTAGGTNLVSTADGSRFFVTDSYNGTVRVYKRTSSTGVESNTSILPSGFRLSQNYPNPFNPTTIIRYEIPTAGPVTLKVYDVLSREVKTLVNEHQIAGGHSATFDAANLPSGIYFYRLQSGPFTETRKLLLVK